MKLLHGPDWYCSPAASAAISRALAENSRRTWDPRSESPSLASLKGLARAYKARYRVSRNRLLRAAGVAIREHRSRRTGALAYIVTMPEEPLSSAIRVDRAARTMEAFR